MTRHTYQEILDFDKWLFAEAGVMETSTRKAYCAAITGFYEVVGKDHYRDLVRDDLEVYKTFLKEKGFSDKTICSRCYPIVLFAKSLAPYVLPFDFSFGHYVPERNELLEQIYKGEGHDQARAYAALIAVYGFTIGEIVSLRRDQIDPVYLRIKGVKVGRGTMALIMAVTKVRKDKCDRGFVHFWNGAWKGVTRYQVSSVIEDWGMGWNQKEKTTPMALYRYYARYSTNLRRRRDY